MNDVLTEQLAHNGSYAYGSYSQLLRSLARIHLLILADELRDSRFRSQAKDLLEIIDDCYGRSVSLVAIHSEAVQDHLSHNAYHLELLRDSMRKTHSRLKDLGFSN